MMSEHEYQRDLMDVPPQVARKMEPDSVYRVLHELGPSLLRDEDFAEVYADREGRPSHLPSLMGGILLLQRHVDVSDRETTERLQFDLRSRHALRLPMDFPEIPHSNLSHFRSRLVVHELEGQVFDRLAEMATEAGVVDPSEQQAIDSSHIFGAAAMQDTYELLQDGTRKLLETALEEAPKAGKALIENQELEGRLSTDKPDIDWTSSEERREWLQGIVSDAPALLGTLDGHRLASSEAVREAAELLSQILAQDITDPVATGSEENGVEENGVEGGPQIREGVATDRIISTIDPEMRHGRKSSSTRFGGYKVHISKAIESEFITGVAVSPGNQHDAASAEDLVEQVRERFGRAPPVLIGDSHYGSPDLRVALKEAFQEQEGENQEGEDQEVEVVAKLPTATGGNGDRFDKTDFLVDLEEERVTCPAGHRAETSYQTRDHSGRPVQRFQFDGDVCAECPLRSECTSAKNGRTTRASLPRGEGPRGAGLQRNGGVREALPRAPSEPERKLSELLWTCGLRFGRYVGQKKTELQALLTAAVANLKRAGTDLIEKLLPSGSPTGRPTDQMVPATG